MIYSLCKEPLSGLYNTQKTDLVTTCNNYKDRQGALNIIQVFVLSTFSLGRSYYRQLSPRNDAFRTGVLANRADSATIELSFLSVEELRVGPESVSGISVFRTGAIFRRNKLRRSRFSCSCGCPWKSGIKSGLGRCRTLRLGQMSFKFCDSLGERRCLVLFLQAKSSSRVGE